MGQVQPEHWIFAYGSLMWDPGFDVVERVCARLDGFSRSFCMTSVVYRGTFDQPGLVLALDQDSQGHCLGLALRVSSQNWPSTIDALRKRELTTMAYREASLPLTLDDGRKVQAVTYVTRHDHPQYIGHLSEVAQARIISQAKGERGPNCDYLFNTVHHLAQLGIQDHGMEALMQQVTQMMDKNTSGTRS